MSYITAYFTKKYQPDTPKLPLSFRAKSWLRKNAILITLLIVIGVIIGLVLIIFDMGAEINALTHKVDKLTAANVGLKADNKTLSEDCMFYLHKIDSLRAEKVTITSKSTSLKSIGTFEVTYYTTGEKGVTGITKTGTVATAKRTIAVDPEVVPLGTKVYINGIGERTAEDVGGLIKGRRIDVFVDGPSDIPSVGRLKAKVWREV